MNDKILSQTDLVEITGYKIPGKQIEVLRKHGIEFIRRPDNTLCVLWKWIENLSENKKIDPTRPKLMSSR